MKYSGSNLFGLFTLIYLALSSCRCAENSAAGENSFKPQINVDTIGNSLRDSSMKKIADLLQIGSINEKIAGEEIRIWYNDISLIGKIVVIKNDQGWQSSGYDYTARINDKFEITSLEKNVRSNVPSSGWNSFLNQLADMGIYELQDSQDIPDYISCHDGETVAFEIRKDNVLKRFFYPCFMLVQDSLKEVKKVKNICLLVQNELGYKLLPEN